MSGPKKIIILGATGGCVDILNLVTDVNRASTNPVYEFIGFLDDNDDLADTTVLGQKVLGRFSDAKSFSEDVFFITGIGSPLNFWKRDRIIDLLGIPLGRFETIIHPRASISSYSEIGRGCAIYQFSSIMTNAKIGNHVLVLPNSTINHDCRVGNYSIVTTGVALSGDVDVQEACYLGSNSVVRQNVTIGKQSMVGMGAVVVNDVPSSSVVIGNPAKVVKKIGVSA